MNKEDKIMNRKKRTTILDYNELNKAIGNDIVAKILGWCCIIGAIVVFIGTLISYFDWNSKKADYSREYVYSNYGNLYYEKDGINVYVEKIYNTDNEIISLNIPDKKTVIMYCHKNNNGECIYFDQNNTIDQSMENLYLPFVVILFLISIGVFLTAKKRFNKSISENGKEVENGTSISHLYLLCITLFVFGMGIIFSELLSLIKYFNIKANNNVTTATIYSEIYNVGVRENSYKPVSYYYVDNHKYIYVDKYYVRGNINENMGKTFELYYNKDNPNDVSKKENPVNYLLLFIAICLSGLAFPFVFFKKKMEKRYDRIMEKRQNQE